MKNNPTVAMFRAELAELEKNGATVEQLQLFCRRIKAHSDVEALADARPSLLTRFVNPTSVLVYTALIAALATLVTSKIQQASYDNYFRSMIGQAAVTSSGSRSKVAGKLLLLYDAEILALSPAAIKHLDAEAAKETRTEVITPK